MSGPFVIWDEHPIGLIPDSALDRILDQRTGTARRMRRVRGLPPAYGARSRPFPAAPDRWYQWLDRWGADRVTAYVARYMPDLAGKLADAIATRGLPPKPRVRTYASKAKPKAPTPAPAPAPEPPALPRRPSPVPSRDREAPVSRLTREQETQAVQEFLARRNAAKSKEPTC